MLIRSTSLIRRLCVVALCTGLTFTAACGDDSSVEADAGGADALVGDGGTDAGSDAGTDAGSDVGPGDAGTDAPADAGADAGFVCEADQWRDFSTTTCMDCPAGSISCEDFDLTMVDFDMDAGTLTIPLMDGVTEIVDGAFLLNIRTTGGEFMTIEATITPDGNSLVGDLSGLPDDFEALDSVSWDMTDACDTNHTSSGDIQAPGTIGMFGCES